MALSMMVNSNSGQQCKNHTSFEAKMTKIDTLFMTTAAINPYPLGSHMIAHMREYPLPPVFC